MKDLILAEHLHFEYVREEEENLELIRYARQRIPDISFTSDIIVGFPGETREDFLQTMDLIRQVRYDSLFTFIYSKRVGTKAASMDDPTPAEDKTKWLMELLEEQKRIGEQQLQRYVGDTMRVLADGPGKAGEGYLTGRTEQNLIVDFPASEELIGSFVEVTITKALNWALLGEINTSHR